MKPSKECRYFAEDGFDDCPACECYEKRVEYDRKPVEVAFCRDGFAEDEELEMEPVMPWE